MMIQNKAQGTPLVSSDDDSVAATKLTSTLAVVVVVVVRRPGIITGHRTSRLVVEAFVMSVLVVPSVVDKVAELSAADVTTAAVGPEVVVTTDAGAAAVELVPANVVAAVVVDVRVVKVSGATDTRTSGAEALFSTPQRLIPRCI